MKLADGAFRGAISIPAGLTSRPSSSAPGWRSSSSAAKSPWPLPTSRTRAGLGAEPEQVEDDLRR